MRLGSYLVGNGRWCSCCYPEGRPEMEGFYPKKRPRRGCNECAGQGRITFSAEEIIAATIAELRAWRAAA